MHNTTKLNKYLDYAVDFLESYKFDEALEALSEAERFFDEDDASEEDKLRFKIIKFEVNAQ